MTISNLLHLLYKGNYSNLNVQTYDPEISTSYKWENAHSEEFLLASYGNCRRTNISKGSTYISIDRKSLFIIVDPKLKNKFRMDHMGNGYGEFGPTTEGNYDYFSYDMEISLHDSRIFAGKLCKDYDDYGNNTLQMCAWNALEKKLLEWYGCIPPWAQYSNQCEENKTIQVTEQSRKEMTEEFNRLAVGQDFKVQKSCLPPCETMSIKLKQLKHITNNPDAAGVRIDVTKKTVDVYTLVRAYDEFNLVVDLGSALGLWFGLSAISIYDIIAEVFVTIKNKYYH